MTLVESPMEITSASGCSDSAVCRSIVQAAAGELRSFISSILGSQLVDETEFLKGGGRWLEIPCWDHPIHAVPGPLREKVPAKTALRYHVVPLREDENVKVRSLRLGLILVRRLPILLAILVAAWLFAHPEPLIGFALAAALSIARAIDAGPL